MALNGCGKSAVFSLLQVTPLFVVHLFGASIWRCCMGDPAGVKRIMCSVLVSGLGEPVCVFVRIPGTYDIYLLTVICPFSLIDAFRG